MRPNAPQMRSRVLQFMFFISVKVIGLWVIGACISVSFLSHEIHETCIADFLSTVLY